MVRTATNLVSGSKAAIELSLHDRRPRARRRTDRHPGAFHTHPNATPGPSRRTRSVCGPTLRHHRFTVYVRYHWQKRILKLECKVSELEPKTTRPFKMAWPSRMIREFLIRLRNAPNELRWRGPFRFSLLVLREIFSPLLYWHVFYVFEKDVHLLEPERTAEFDVKVCAGRDHFDELVREIVPMGEISAKVIESRLASNDIVAVAHAGSEPVGYAWMALESGLETAFDTIWVLGAKEAVFYGSFTHPHWRGRGVQHELDAMLMLCARKNHINKIFATVSALNRPSLRAFDTVHQRNIMTLMLARVRGLKWVYRKSIGAPIESHFAVSPKGKKSRRVSTE